MARAQYDDVLGRPLLDALELLEDLVGERCLDAFDPHIRFSLADEGQQLAYFFALCFLLIGLLLLAGFGAGFR